MKLQLIQNETNTNDSAYILQFMNIIKKYAGFNRNTNSNDPKNEINSMDNDNNFIENNLRIDFMKTDSDVGGHHSGPIQFVLFIDKEPHFSESSIPVMIFSLDLLLEEKIEMLDASIASEESISMMQSIVVRLNNNKNLLQDALKRHLIKQNQNKKRNSPLW